MTREEAIAYFKDMNECTYGNVEPIQMAIEALKTLEDFERAQLITGGRLNGRTYAYKCGLEDGRRKALEQEIPKTKWIPVSERLPEDRDWYLGIFKESDTGWINPVPFICDYIGFKTDSTTKEGWILKGYTDIDKPIDYYINLECVVWQPLPKPYEEERKIEE